MNTTPPALPEDDNDRWSNKTFRVVSILVVWWFVSIIAAAAITTAPPDTISFAKRLASTSDMILDGTMFAVFWAPPAALLARIGAILVRKVRGRPMSRREPERASRPWRKQVGPFFYGLLAWWYLCIYGMVALFLTDLSYFWQWDTFATLHVVALWGTLFAVPSGIVGGPVCIVLAYGAVAGIQRYRGSGRAS